MSQLQLRRTLVQHNITELVEQKPIPFIFISMNKAVLEKYGIAILSSNEGYAAINTGSHYSIIANSPSLAIYMNGFLDYGGELEDFIETLNLACDGNYDIIENDKKEWDQELGTHLYSGSINEDFTFDLSFYNSEDASPKTVERFPVSDIKEIFSHLLERVKEAKS